MDIHSYIFLYIISFIIPEVALQPDNNLALSEIASLLMDRNVDRSQLRNPWLYHKADRKIIIIHCLCQNPMDRGPLTAQAQTEPLSFYLLIHE